MIKKALKDNTKLDKYQQPDLDRKIKKFINSKYPGDTEEIADANGKALCKKASEMLKKRSKC